MASWTLDQSTVLSHLLDEVVGTQMMIDIRTDYCMISDCFMSKEAQNKSRYFTGSKAEGLDLPGSDMDFMIDINDLYHIKVIQSLEEIPEISPYTHILNVYCKCSTWFCNFKARGPNSGAPMCVFFIAKYEWRATS